MLKMLDPKARFPKGPDDRQGLELLEIARRATTEEHASRPTIETVGFRAFAFLSHCLDLFL